MVTGLYQETHGVVANIMYDAQLNATAAFTGLNDSKWWYVQAIPLDKSRLPADDSGKDTFYATLFLSISRNAGMRAFTFPVQHGEFELACSSAFRMRHTRIHFILGLRIPTLNQFGSVINYQMILSHGDQV
jgi:hypothetical protein